MPALAFGLKSGKSQQSIGNRPLKRKGVFGDGNIDDNAEDEDSNAFAKIAKPAEKSTKLKLRPILDDEETDPNTAPAKAKKTSLNSGSHHANNATRYTNLSALRSAKLHDEQASKVDASVYDYDAVYETFHAKPKPKSDDESSGPKYMRSLMASADVRKRDQLRAREKQVAKERENEGDEFADKEKFVTGAYKKAQEEMRKIEEEEKRKDEAEEERRREGGGMEAFNRSLLRKEEERQKMIAQATAEAQQRKDRGETDDQEHDNEDGDNDEVTAKQLSESGARIAINDDGEILDKRQLLGAGLNIAPKKKLDLSRAKKQHSDDRAKEWQRPSKVQDARVGQRERQSRMIERQIEEMAKKQHETEEAERQQAEAKNKSKVSEDAKLGAKERYLQRKKEREEEAKKKAAAAG